MTEDGPSWWYQDTFPLEAFPDAVRLMVEQTADSLCVHPDMLATAALPIFGALIGNKRRIVTHQKTWTEPPRIWAAVIADPGAKKSPALSKLMAPLGKIRDELDGYYENQRADWVANDSRPKPPAPKPVRFKLSDLTTAVIRDRLSTHPKGVLVYRDELSGWLESLSGRTFGGGGDRQLWLELWPENAELQVDRKAENESTVVPQAFVGLFGGIQPDKLRHIAGRDGDDGMLDRFLLCKPPFVEQVWGASQLEPTVAAAYGEIVDELYHMACGEIGGRISPRLVEMDVGGMALARDFFENHYAQLNNYRRIGHPLTGMWAKCDAYVYRVALILTELWHVCEDAPEIVDEHRMLGASRVVDYFKNQRNALQTLLEASEYTKAGPADEQRVVDFLRAQGGKTTQRQLMRGPLRRLRVREAREVLDGLTEKGQVEMGNVPGKKGILVILT